MGLDGGNGLFVGVFRLIVIIEFSVTGCQNDFVILENRMVLQFLCQCCGAVHTVQQPKRMLQFVSQFGRGKRKLLLYRQRIQETVNGVVVNKASVVRRKEFVQIKGVILKFFRNRMFQKFRNNIRHLVGKEVQLRQIGIGIRSFRVIPIALGFLLVGIGPVEDRFLLELVVCQRFEGRTGEVQRKFAFNLIKSDIGFIGVDAFMGFVDHKHIPFAVYEFIKFIKFSSEIFGSFEILKADKLNDAFCVIF